MTLHGRVENGVVVFQNGATLADGTLVEVTPLRCEAGGPPAVRAALEAAPQVPPETELERASAAGHRRAATMDPFAGSVPVSKERQEALRQLIGICKTEHPPDDEEVERIIEEERMKKYG